MCPSPHVTEDPVRAARRLLCVLLLVLAVAFGGGAGSAVGAERTVASSSAESCCDEAGPEARTAELRRGRGGTRAECACRQARTARPPGGARAGAAGAARRLCGRRRPCGVPGPALLTGTELYAPVPIPLQQREVIRHAHRPVRRTERHAPRRGGPDDIPHPARPNRPSPPRPRPQPRPRTRRRSGNRVLPRVPDPAPVRKSRPTAAGSAQS
ncbi:hypothetical protein ACU686_41590 [Yinghuangia aomiensis]